jgi:WD40 repeat protein
MLKGHTDFIKTVAFAPDSKRLASGSQDGTIRLWSVSKIWCREQAVLQGHSGHVHSVLFAPDGRTLVSASADETLRLWDLTGPVPEVRAVLEGHMGVVRRVQFTPDGRSLISVGDRGRVMQWILATGEKLCEWLLPKMMASSFAFTFDARYLATGNSDGTAFVFRLGEKR